ncbi:MAG: hypothetical protein BWY77_01781 [bacterium ADurb.Bin431]|nr:MAG: hypothetical protein BWY77_01781 [bacterium ADurb.Bin431]
MDERLRRLTPAGLPATARGDLLSLRVGRQKPLVVSWNGSEVRVTRREAKKPFCRWSMSEGSFKRLFLGSCPPLLVAMNNDQSNIRMGKDHHNGSLVVSFMVMLQECLEGGATR